MKNEIIMTIIRLCNSLDELGEDVKASTEYCPDRIKSELIYLQGYAAAIRSAILEGDSDDE